MDKIQSFFTSFTSSDIEPLSLIKMMLIISAACFLIGLLFRVISGKRSGINQAISSAMGILVIYIVTFFLATTIERPEIFTDSLPFIRFSGDHVSIFHFKSAGTQAIAYELVRMMILAFIVNLFETVMPKGKGFFKWFLLRCLIVAISLVANGLIFYLFSAFLPNVLATYAPIILFILVVILLAVSVFKLIIGIILGMTLGPIVGAIYTFFFSNIVGKILTKTTLTTVILSLFVFLLNHFEIALILISTTALTALIPFIILLIILWYLLFKLL